MKNEPFVIERVMNAPVSRVWEALTDNEKMKQWYFDIPNFKAEVGSEFEFDSGKDKIYLHRWKITEVIKEKKLAYTWQYPGYEGNSLVTIELFPEGDKTKVRLTHEGLHTFANNPDFAVSNFVAGWTGIIGTNLVNFVEGK